MFVKDDWGKLVLRLSLGVLILLHGIAKLVNTGSLGFISGELSSAGLPEFLAYGVYVGEVLAPLLIIFGIYCRIGGAIVAINMLFAIMLVHTAELMQLTDSGGWALELQGMFLFGAVAVTLMGSGRIAVRPD